MNVRESRFKNDLTQYDLSLMSGIHQSRISLIESGYVLPTDEEKRKLAAALGVDPGELAFELKRIDASFQSLDQSDAITNYK
jgi:transcriptional regulator with XRE-family HTH domain